VHVETEQVGETFIIRMNRPDRLNALGAVMREELEAAWSHFESTDGLEVAIFTGTGRAFCVGEDMKESVERGGPRDRSDMRRNDDLYRRGLISKPVIVAVNGYAMGGGFGLVENGDFRLAARGAIFEMSEAKRWLIGGYAHGVIGNVSHPIGTEMAFAFRFTAERLYELGYLNRLTDDEGLMPEALAMAKHILSLPPASRVNTLQMMRSLRPAVSDDHRALAELMHSHGAISDLLESRKAFAEKRDPVWKGWDNPGDRYNTPTLKTVRSMKATGNQTNQ